jgi:outer membrane PBP1 activator LpoA protein
LTAIRPLFVVLAALAVLAGCATMPPPATEERPFDSPQLDDAEAAQRLGDTTSAITLLHMAADQAPAPTRTRLRLEAAVLATQLADDMDAPDPPGRAASPATQALREMLAIRQAADRPDPDKARSLARLEGQVSARIEPLRRLWEGQSRMAAGEYVKAVTALTGIYDAPQASATHRLTAESVLWRALIALDGTQADDWPAPATANTDLGGWKELADGVARHALNPDATRRFLRQWRRRHPQHPATGMLLTRIRLMQRADLSPARRVAVLLPLSGELANAGALIQRGILAAYHASDSQRRPRRLDFIDTGEAGLPPRFAYQRALNQGAGQVIGPLRKAAVRELARNLDRSRPTIALNRLETRPPADRLPGFYQFGLAPEDDARTMAEAARRLGYQRLAVLRRADDWGRRVGQAFRDALTDRDGRIAEVVSYSPEAQDLAVPIRQLLNLDASDGRHERIQSITGTRLRFEARRRMDIDGVFVAARQPDARLVLPQIRFHRGIGLPVLGVADAHDEQPAAEVNNDLEGLMLPRLPWLMGRNPDPGSQRARQQLDAAGLESQHRLLALGIDAYNLLSRIDALLRYPSLRTAGATGTLAVDTRQRIRRTTPVMEITPDGLRPVNLPKKTEVEDGQSTNREGR